MTDQFFTVRGKLTYTGDVRVRAVDADHAETRAREKLDHDGLSAFEGGRWYADAETSFAEPVEPDSLSS